MKNLGSKRTVVAPPAGTEVFVNADFSRPARLNGVTRKDEGQMSGLGDHGIVAVGSALAVTTGMDMHICYDSHFQITALLPDLAESAAVELNDAIGKTSRINVVIVKELSDCPGGPTIVAEQEGAAFVPTFGAPVEFFDALIPNP